MTALRWTIVGLLILIAHLRSARAVQITRFSPPAGPMGTVVHLEGSGFADTRRVLFHRVPGASDAPVEARFTVLADTGLDVTVPDMAPRRAEPTVITVLSDDSAAVTVPCSDLIEVTSTVTNGRGGTGFLVRNGGALYGGGGDMYVVESGGVVYGRGGTFYVESGGILRGWWGIAYLQSGASLQAGSVCSSPDRCHPVQPCFIGPVFLGLGATIVPPCGTNVIPLIDVAFSPRPTPCEPGSGLFTLLPPPEAVCGDGVVGFREQCDDGNTLAGDGCSTLCRLERCGNGTIDPGEACDDGNVSDADGCTQCSIVPAPDADTDEVPDFVDNCPAVPNGPRERDLAGVGFQTDSDADGVGDACEPAPTGGGGGPDEPGPGPGPELGQCPAATSGPDTDGDGEADASDACPGTPAGARVDDGGCAQVQFCAAVGVTTRRGSARCRRSDWRNDEPVVDPRDCAVDPGARGRRDDRCVPR